MRLTKEQIDKFNQDGFLVIKDFAPLELCDKILEKAKEHLKNKIAPIETESEYLEANDETNTVRRLRQVYQREDIFKEWMTYSEIKPMLKQIFDEDVVLTLAHHNSIMTKMPKESSRTSWHQDRRYWSFENDNLVSIWLSLDDEFIENGLLEFIPRSHKLKFEKEQFDEKSNFLDLHPKNIEIIKNRAHANLKKGDIVLFHCKTLHHAGKNRTDKPKISFVYTVRAKSNKPLSNTRSDFKEVNLD